MKILKKGDKCPEVGNVQRRLKIDVDDDFGPLTEKAVKEYQMANGLNPDGIVGPITHAKMFKQNIGIPVVHLSKKGVSRNQESTRAFPLSESNIPFFDGSIDSIHGIIDWLDVEKSPRYKRKQHSTYCNIYAYDYAYLMRAFLPRVWWYERAINNQTFTPEYAKTVHELNANSLADWFPHYGAQFGWEKLSSTTQAQERANAGECVIMVAANKNRKRSGHIVAVVPETDEHEAVGARGITIYPLQSQAGGVNQKYFSYKWWNGMEKLRIYSCKTKPIK